MTNCYDLALTVNKFLDVMQVTCMYHWGPIVSVKVSVESKELIQNITNVLIIFA